MKKSKKAIIKIFSVVMVLMFVFTIGANIFAAEVTPGLPNTGSDKITGITDMGNKVWNTISVIVQIAAIAAIVFAGVRYMFASADDKADIKKQTVILIVGAVLVFAAVPLAKFITNIAQNVL